MDIKDPCQTTMIEIFLAKVVKSWLFTVFGKKLIQKCLTRA